MGRRFRATGGLAVADEGDSELTRFLAYVVAALQTIDTSVGRGVLGLLQSPRGHRPPNRF